VLFVGSFHQVGGAVQTKEVQTEKIAAISAFHHLSSYDTARYTRIVLFVGSYRQVGGAVQTKEVQWKNAGENAFKWPLILLSVH
jgi:hypothetical protein